MPLFGGLANRNVSNSESPRLALSKDAIPVYKSLKEAEDDNLFSKENPGEKAYVGFDSKSGIYMNCITGETYGKMPDQDLLKSHLIKNEIPFAEITDVMGNSRIRFDDRQSGTGLTSYDQYFSSDGYYIGRISVDPYEGVFAEMGSDFIIEHSEGMEGDLSSRQFIELLDDYGLKGLTTIDAEFAIRDELAVATAIKVRETQLDKSKGKDVQSIYGRSPVAATNGFSMAGQSVDDLLKNDFAPAGKSADDTLKDDNSNKKKSDYNNVRLDIISKALLPADEPKTILPVDEPKKKEHLSIDDLASAPSSSHSRLKALIEKERDKEHEARGKQLNADSIIEDDNDGIAAPWE